MTTQTNRPADARSSPPRPPTRRRIVWLLAVAVAVVVAGVVGVTAAGWLTGDRGPSGQPADSFSAPKDTPLAATRNYLEAMKANDPEAARATLAEMFHASPFGSGDADPLLDDYRDVELEREDGPKAWVLATLTFAADAEDPGEMLVQFTLERMADGWYITLFYFDYSGQPE